MKTDWSKAILPLIKKYGKRKHPLNFKNTYQLLIMVILAARDTDKNINLVSADLFKTFPSMVKPECRCRFWEQKFVVRRIRIMQSA